MNKKSLLLSLLIILGLHFSSDAQMLTEIGSVQFPGILYPGTTDTVGGSDCWGWTAPDGTEYAIMGTYEGTEIVRIPDMTVVDHIAGPQFSDNFFHRDMVTYGNYLYVVNTLTGAEEGLQIIDMSFLPDSVSLIATILGDTATPWTQSHNMDIDSAMGFMYLVDHWYQGIRIFDLANPIAPLEVGFINTINTHDMYARNDTVWVAEGWSYAYSVWKVNDKSNPTMISYITDTDFGYAHNIWPMDDGRYFLTTEETATKTVKIWDMADTTNVVLRGEYLAPCGLAHNVHVMGDSVYISHYESGIRVVNIADVDSPVEVAWYDTYPSSDSGEYHGCWGAYPYTESGYIYSTDIEGSLRVFHLDSVVVVGIEEELNPPSISIIPNPVSAGSMIQLDGLPLGEINLTITDLSGRIVYRSTEVVLDATLSIDLSEELGPGMYLISCENTNAKMQARLLVE